MGVSNLPDNPDEDPHRDGDAFWCSKRDRSVRSGRDVHGQDELDISAMNGAGQMKEKKDMAMKEMMSAQEAMAANKMDECTTHMNNAMQAMQGSNMDGQSRQMDNSGQTNTAQEPTVGTSKADSPEPQQ